MAGVAPVPDSHCHKAWYGDSTRSQYHDNKIDSLSTLGLRIPVVTATQIGTQAVTPCDSLLLLWLSGVCSVCWTGSHVLLVYPTRVQKQS